MQRIYSYPIILFVTTLLGCTSNQLKSQDGDQSVTRNGPVVLDVDFSSREQFITEVYDFFDVAVRTERGNPKSKPATFGRKAKVNTVRMLGGWFNQDLSGDTYQWDGDKYVYNFSAATKRIDAWLKNDWDIFQIVLDNPPWAFQRGYDFVEQADGQHYLAKDRVGVYGNGLPPFDKHAWHNYIQAFMQHLVETYGKEKVLSWRFRIGSEIDTRPQHWAATRQEFFDHYENTVTAVKSILPNAKVGAHFREATHQSRYIDYTGNKEDAYAPYFVSWAKQHRVPYDFLAISYYPHITHPHEMDMEQVYQSQIAPILEHPDYHEDASFEIHEYKFIVKMKRAGFVSVATSHNSAFFAMFSKMMLEKNIQKVFQWGNASGGSYSPEAMTQLALNDMVGNKLYKNSRTGQTQTTGNLVDGIFTQRQDNLGIDALIFNFNNINTSYQQSESLELALKVNVPAGTKVQYRIAQLDQNVSPEQLFYVDHPKALLTESQGGWRLENSHPTASVKSSLNLEGQEEFKQSRAKYKTHTLLQWGKWQSSVTKKTDSTNSSTIRLMNQIPSFAVQKYQIRWQQQGARQ